MKRGSRRRYSKAEQAMIIAGYSAWTGTQGAYARSRGISATTLSRWLSASAPAKATTAAPAMLEVIRPPMHTAAPSRLVLGGEVALELEELPSPRWLATLVSELRRC